MDTVIERGGLRDATASEYRSKAILRDVSTQTPTRSTTSVQVAPAETGCLNLRRASAATTSSAGTSALRRAQQLTRPPRGGKLRAARKGRERLGRSGSGKPPRRDGRVILGEERRLQITTAPRNLCDHPPGRDLTSSAPVQTGTKGPPGCWGKEGRNRSTAASGVGVER